MGNFRRDIRQGVRIFVKNPVFTLAAAVSLGLAIGANSAIFSMFNARHAHRGRTGVRRA